MGLWARLAAAIKGTSDASNGDEGAWWSNAIGSGGGTSAGVFVNQFTAMQCAAVMACVSIIAEDVAKLKLRLWEHLDNGGKRPATNHPLYKLLLKPNSWQTQFEFVEQMQASLLLRSNAYAVKLRDGRGRVTELVPINPDRVTLYESPGGMWFYFVSRQGLHEMAVLEDQPYLIPSDDVFHLRWLSQWSSLIGTSRVSLMREPIGLALSQEQLAARLAGSSARLGGVLQTDKKLTPDVLERLKTDWSDKYEGLRNAGRTAILEQGLKFQQTTMTSADAEFQPARDFQLMEVARMFRMPPHKLGVIQRGNAGTIQTQDQDYLNNTIMSHIERWEQKIVTDFELDEDKYFPEFDVSRFLRADIKTRYEAYRLATGTPWLTVNEPRRAEGMADVAKGDVVLQPGNMVPLGTLPGAGKGGPGSDSSGTFGDGGAGDPANTDDDNNQPS